MATTERLSTAVAQNIAGQIAERLPAAMGPAAAPGAAGPALGETLKIRLLPLNQIVNGSGPLETRLSDTGQWHHQVYQGEQAVSFARSTAPGSGSDAAHEVVEVAQSTLPDDLRDAIAWIDANAPEDAEASLIAAPDYFLTAVWLRGPAVDAVVIASMADGLTKLSKRRLIPSAEFLQSLAESTPVRGLGPIADQAGGAP